MQIFLCASYWIPGRELQVSIRTPLLHSNRKSQPKFRNRHRSSEVSPVAWKAMADKTFLIRFKLATYLSPRPVLAARAEIQGEHLILLNSQNKLAAMFLLEVVDSWAEVKWNA